MRIPFTKMHGAGNDFIVLDETRQSYGLTAAQYRWMADRHFGIGADQILTVRPAPVSGVDFEYVIHNADGGRVENCGNGARCFVRYVHEHGLSTAERVVVQVSGGRMTLHLGNDGRVTVDMGPPVFEWAQVPFAGPIPPHEAPWGPVRLGPLPGAGPDTGLDVAVLSMGNPHAVCRVDDVEQAPVGLWGPWLESHPAFPRRANAGFLQVLDRAHVRLRVYERGAGETLACGTGACAAVVAGIRQGWLDGTVDVETRGGVLTIAWDGQQDVSAPVWMTGPAVTVFEGVVDVPDHLSVTPSPVAA